MQDNVLAVMMAVLLVFFLWSVSQRRNDRTFRFWLLGWSLVMVHFLTLLWHPASGLAHRLREGDIAMLEILAGVCFILTEPTILCDRGRMARIFFLGSVPTLGTIAVILFAPQYDKVLYLTIVISHGYAMMLAVRFMGHQRVKCIALVTMLTAAAVAMTVVLLMHRPELIISTIPAEIFLMNAILFASNYRTRGPGMVTAVLGFVLWSVVSALTIELRIRGIADAWFPSFLHLPEFFVAIGMTMIAFEEDAQAARQTADEYEMLFNSNPNSIWIYERDSLQFLSVNRVAAENHGYTVEELLTKKVTDTIVPELRSMAQVHIAEGKAIDNRRTVHMRKDGSRFPVNVTAYDVVFRGRPARMAIGEDLSERERVYGQLIYQLEHDVLTELPNRRKLLSLLATICEEAQKHGGTCALLVLQIERFEKINEIYGYGVGDALLMEVARVLRSAAGPLDVVGRTGGSEFTMALAGLQGGDMAASRAEEIQSLFEGMMMVGTQRLEVGVTIGLAVYPEDSDDAAMLWRDAVRAHGLSRRPGGQSPARLSRTMSEREKEDNRLEMLMRQALLLGGFELFYQPIVNGDRQVCALEALLRLHEEDGTMVSPVRFIPVAETTGVIVQMGKWVLQQACRQIRAWQVAGRTVVPVAVNVSAHQLAQPNLFSDVQVALEEFDLDPQLLQMEVTESSVMLDKTLALEHMERLSGLGIQFSIDDFGTGFSSMDRLHQLPVATLKIDRSFVMRMMEPSGTRPIVATITSMAHSLGLSVIAEGVETEEQFSALRGMGCDLFQGFLFSRPIPAAEATERFF